MGQEFPTAIEVSLWCERFEDRILVSEIDNQHALHQFIARKRNPALPSRRASVGGSTPCSTSRLTRKACAQIGDDVVPTVVPSVLVEQIGQLWRSLDSIHRGNGNDHIRLAQRTAVLLHPRQQLLGELWARCAQTCRHDLGGCERRAARTRCHSCVRSRACDRFERIRQMIRTIRPQFIDEVARSVVLEVARSPSAHLSKRTILRLGRGGIDRSLESGAFEEPHPQPIAVALSAPRSPVRPVLAWCGRSSPCSRG